MAIQKIQHGHRRVCVIWIPVLCLAVLSSVSLFSSKAYADDWPTYRNDITRSGVSTDVVAPPLTSAWTYSSPYPPQPAWPGPARRDGWHKTENLKARVIFDWAFHVVSDEKSVYFGSSVDDQIYCLDAKSGDVKWTYFTEGPIRLAPMIYQGKVYVGGDDGYVYCLNAEDGSLIWKFHAAPKDYRVAGNERIVSVWPIRTGILVDKDIAYFCSGIFANEGVQAFALNALDGTVIWKQEITNILPQGYLLASDTKLYAPGGNGPPAVLDRKSGELLRSLGGSGGTFCLLTEDALFYGPGKTGTLDVFETSQNDQNDQLTTFDGNTMIVTPGKAFLHTDTQLSAVDLKRDMQLLRERKVLSDKQDKIKKEFETFIKENKENVTSEKAKELRAQIEDLSVQIGKIEQERKTCLAWTHPCSYPYSLVVAGNVLYAGGKNQIAAIDMESGEIVWTGKVNGRALDLALAGGKLLASTDKGTIHCFQPQKLSLNIGE